MILFVYRNHSDPFCILPFKCFRFPVKYLGDSICIHDNCCPHCPVQYQKSRGKSSCGAGCRPGGYFIKNMSWEILVNWVLGKSTFHLKKLKKKPWMQVLKIAKGMDHRPTADKCSLSSDIWSHVVSVGDFNNLSWSPLPRLSKATDGKRSSEAWAEPDFHGVWGFSSF